MKAVVLCAGGKAGFLVRKVGLQVKDMQLQHRDVRLQSGDLYLQLRDADFSENGRFFSMSRAKKLSDRESRPFPVYIGCAALNV